MGAFVLDQAAAAYIESSTSQANIGTATTLVAIKRFEGAQLLDPADTEDRMLFEIGGGGSTDSRFRVTMTHVSPNIRFYLNPGGDLTDGSIINYARSSIVSGDYYLLHVYVTNATPWHRIELCASDGTVLVGSEGTYNITNNPNSANGRVRIGQVFNSVGSGVGSLGKEDGFAVYSTIAAVRINPAATDANILAFWAYKEGSGTSAANEVAGGQALDTFSGSISHVAGGTWNGLDPTAAVTGTATASITEADIVAGGETVIITLTDATWVPASEQLTPVYVGGQTNSFAGTTTEQSINFALTGGLASVPAAGDFVIVSYAAGSAARNPALTIKASSGGTDYTLVDAELYQDDTFESSLRVGYRFMPGTPETLVVLSGTGNAADAGVYTIQVFRNVNAATPLDVAAVPSGGIDSRVVNPASITPTTAGSIIYVVGAGGGGTGGTYTAGYLSNFIADTQVDTNDAFMGAGWVAWTSGAYDPAAFGAGGTSTTSDAWTSMTIALRPVAATAPFNDARQAIIDGLDSAQSEGTGWNAEVRDNLAVTTVARTSNTVVTVTLSAQAAYNITAQETITVTVPAAALVSGGPLTATPTLTVATVASGVTLTPGVGALVVTGFATTVQTPRNVAPAVGALTLTGFAATVQTPRIVRPGVGALDVTGFAASIGTPRTVLPGVGALTATGFAPSVGTPRTVLPATGALDVTGFAASVSTPAVVTPSAGALVLEGFAPIIPSAVTVSPGLGALDLTGFAPSVGSSVAVLPGVGALDVTGFAPSVGTPRTVLPGVGALTLTGFAATVQTPKVLTPAPGALALLGYAPAVVLPQVLRPGVGALDVAGFAPTVQTLQALSPGVGELSLTGFAPSVGLPVTVRPGVGALSVTGFAPTVSTPTVVSTGTGALVVSGFAPAIGTPRTVLPGVGALTLAGLAPSVGTPRTLLPGTGALDVAGHAPVIQFPRVVLPGVGELVLVGFAPTVFARAEVIPGTGALVLSGFAATLTVGQVYDLQVIEFEVSIARRLELTVTVAQAIEEEVPIARRLELSTTV